ncbi:hypothetical protein RND71_031930 [Anisodus tanguticus]|uniref:Uncharacterized protein n=1 Tax=Anisodus tanguticus TaxID=243964 RepID=A0AAE1RBM6_9SOLA|nr:hypothetical protein RND71_031930 [Anisodus tanguticus]
MTVSEMSFLKELRSQAITMSFHPFHCANKGDSSFGTSTFPLMNSSLFLAEGEINTPLFQFP